MIPAVIFTSSAHSSCADLAAERLAALGVSPILVFDRDDPPPVPPQHPFEFSDFHRGGNLRGGLCLAGMLDALARAQGASQVVLKVDADVFLLSSSTLAGPVVAGAASLVGFSDHSGRMRGAAYALDAASLSSSVRHECLSRTSEAYLEARLLHALARSSGFHASLLPRALCEYGAERTESTVAIHCGLAECPQSAMRSLFLRFVTPR